MKAAKASRWPAALSGRRRPTLTSVGCATLLHVAVCAVVLTVVRLSAVPDTPDTQAVEMVFATPQSVSADLVTPSRPPETPAPPEAPVSHETPSPPEIPSAAATIPSMPSPPPPPPPIQNTKPPAAPAPTVRSLAVPKVVLRAKPIPAPRIPETPTTGQAHPPDTPASKPTSGAVSAEAPTAGEWQRSLAAWLAAHKTYPDEARRRNTEGSVVLRFTADRSGRVLDVVLVRSAGSSILDAAALSLVRNAMLPPFTAGMSQDKVTVTIQMHYTLAN